MIGFYSPDTCVFISPKLNSYLKRPKSKPHGVYVRKNGLIVANGKSGYLGSFINKFDAHKAWQIDYEKSLREVAEQNFGEIKLALIAKADKILSDIKSNKETKLKD